jgi:tripartite-type tricarboxylate transporter receptor subunit TctC
MSYLATFTAALVFAQMAAAAPVAPDYPTKPIRMVVPYSAGGASDIVARVVAPRLNESLGQPVVVDNRPGASGNIALEIVARSPADGYTLLLGNISTNSINPTVFTKTLKVDVAKTLTGVTLLASVPTFVVVKSDFPANTLKEFVARAKANPGKYNYGTLPGSFAHLSWLNFMKTTGAKLELIPLTGGSGVGINWLMTGEIHIALFNVSTASGLIKQGRLKPYAVTANKRMPEFPDIATAREEGYPDLESTNWNGVFVPARTPGDIIGKLYTHLTRAMKRPEVQHTLGATYTPITLSASPQDFNAFVQEETRRWANAIASNAVKFE